MRLHWNVPNPSPVIIHLMKKIRLGTIALLLCLTLSLTAETIQILGVGNSFTVNSQKYLPQIIASDPEVDAVVACAYIGGCPLDKHMSLAKAHEANSEEGAKYTYKIDGKDAARNVSLKHMLQDREWDYITIQQVSTKSYKIESYYPHAKDLIDYIKKYAPQAEIIVHETWSHSVDSYRATDWGLDPREMYAKLHAAYNQIAEEYGLRIIPVGTAFENARKTEMWHYEPTSIDLNSLSYPEDKANLPDESKSMNRIFYWKKDKEDNWSVKTDGFHAGRNGEYLGGLMWYQFFFEKDPREITYKPEKMTEAQAVSLRQIAHDTIQ
ncbi:MAG TPA: hypothetical protein DEA90_15940 [Opitutae bacterium]|nr:hypothetical protein [Puniceicoccaceae bacterium]HBR95650.1 hypothetical protein [Opitutae bacterium]